MNKSADGTLASFLKEDAKKNQIILYHHVEVESYLMYQAANYTAIGFKL